MTKLRYGKVKELAPNHTVQMAKVRLLSSMTSILPNDKINARTPSGCTFLSVGILSLLDLVVSGPYLC